MATPRILRVLTYGQPDIDAEPWGLTIGGQLVEIYGGNFKVPPDPARLAPLARVPRTVTVTFGGAPAAEVAVVRGNYLRVLTPPSPLADADGLGPEGTVDVAVQNLDADGAPIPGELASMSAAFRYSLPRLDDSEEQALVQVERALLVRWRRHVLDNTSSFSSVDWDRDVTGVEDPDVLRDGVEIAELPAITLSGPRLVPRRDESGERVLAPGMVAGAPAELLNAIIAAPVVVDLVWDVMGFVGHGGPQGSAGGKTQLLALMQAVIRFVTATPHIEVPRFAADPSRGVARFEFEFTEGGEPSAGERTGGADSDLLAFRAQVRIRRFPLHGWAGVFGDQVLDAVPALLEPWLSVRPRDT